MYIPLGLDRIILGARRKFNTDKFGNVCTLHPNIIIQRIDDLFVELEQIRGEFVIKLQPHCMKMIFII